MGDIDQISQLLGRLQADMEASQRQRTVVFEKLDQLTKDFAAHRAEMQAHMEAEGGLSEQIERIGNRVGELETFKGRIMAYVAVIGTAASAFGSSIAKKMGLI